MMFAIACVVMSSAKHACGWLTTCRGTEENAQVVLDQHVAVGSQATYTPFIHADEDIIHGRVQGIGAAAPVGTPTQVSSDTGKQPT